jgi:hypothetical protein
MISLGIGIPFGRRGGIDPNAAAFIAAAGITDPTQINAINTIVKSLKNANLWDKIIAAYPMVGGSASSHRFNLKDPRDLDAAFRLAFSGGWTHSANGALPNGVNAFAEMFITPNVNLAQNSSHLGYYSRTNVTAGQVEMGSIGVSSIGCYLLYSFNGAAFKTINSIESSQGTIANPTTGFLLGSRNNSTEEFYTHRTTQQTISRASAAPNNRAMVLGAYRNNVPTVAFFSSKQCAFATVGSGLSLAESLTYESIVTTFQTTLGRAV